MMVYHVPRECNSVTNWLGNLVRAERLDVDLTAVLLNAGGGPFSEPLWAPELGLALLVRLQDGY